MMTRSLGDRWFRPVGVIAEPEIGHHAVGAGDVAVVAATDGLWDVLGLDDTARLVRAARAPRRRPARSSTRRSTAAPPTTSRPSWCASPTWTRP